MLDKFRETAITWDKANRKVYEPLRVSAGDNKGRKLSVQVVNGGVIENLSGASLSLFWETKDKAHKGLDAFTAVDAPKGEFEIYYTTGMLSNEGTLNANLVLVDANGRIVSEPFTITVFKGIDDDAIQSSDSFTALTEALAQVGNINNKADRDELLALESIFEQNKLSVNQQLQQKGVNVKIFGAVGDGVTDDGEAIKNAHEFANEHGYPVFYPAGKYYMNNVSEIPVQTSVNASEAEIIIDLEFEPNKRLYRVTSTLESYNYTGSLSNVTISRGETSIPTFEGLGEVMVRIENKNNYMYKRYGDNQDNGVPQYDNLIVNNSGILLNDVAMDFDEITNAIVYPIDTTYLDIVFGKITTLNKQGTEYINKGILISRSRVNISIINEEIKPLSQQSSPFNGILAIFDCAYVTINNSFLQDKPRIYTGTGGFIGSYGLNVARVCYLTLDNVNSKDLPSSIIPWGIMGGNGLKDLVVINSNLSRVDSHRGSHNITVKNSTIGRNGIMVTGSGDLIVEDVIFKNQQGIILRTDYGATWNGRIYLKNIKHIPLGDGRMELITGEMVSSHDFGYSCHIGTEIYIENYEIDDMKDWNVTDGNLRYKHIIRFTGNIDGTVNPYYLPNKITLKNIKRKSGDDFITLFSFLDYGKLKALKPGGYVRKNGVNIINENIIVTLDDVVASDFGFGQGSLSPWSEPNNYTNQTPFVKFRLKNIDGVVMNMGASPIALEIESSVIKNLNLYASNESRSTINIYGCIIDTQQMYPTISNHLGAHYPSTNIFNTLFKTPKNIDGVEILDTTNLLNAHRFLGFMRQTGQVAMRANIIGCYFSPTYPLDIIFPAWNTLGIDFTTFVNQQYYPLDYEPYS